jgi:predicted nucleotidyltransferase
MLQPECQEKREQFLRFVQRKLELETAVQAVFVVGSVAAGTAHADSDIDAIILMNPIDHYIVPAEAIWRESDDSFHSIFTPNEEVERTGLQLDLKRLDWQTWRQSEWPEPLRAEWGEAWIAFDRTGQVPQIIAAHTSYDDTIRLARLDDGITWLDQHLGGSGPETRWNTLGPVIAHDRLQAAYDQFVVVLFAYNRRWRPWRNREMTALLSLPWVPAGFRVQALAALNAPSHDFAGYQARVTLLRSLFAGTLEQLMRDGTYGGNPVGEAFIRIHDEPGRSWNMEEWNRRRSRSTRP